MRLRQARISASDLLTEEETSALFRACSRPHHRALLEFIIESGCRIQEVLELKMRDIKFQEHFLIITLNGKTGERTIPLYKDNLPAFLFYLTSRLNEEIIFPFTYIAVNKQFRRLYKKAGLEKPKRMFHIFRHMKATYLLESGIPENIIKEFLGWSDASNMAQYYTHLNTRKLTDFFARHYGVASEPLRPLYPDEERNRVKEILE